MIYKTGIAVFFQAYDYRNCYSYKLSMIIRYDQIFITKNMTLKDTSRIVSNFDT